MVQIPSFIAVVLIVFLGLAFIGLASNLSADKYPRESKSIQKSSDKVGALIVGTLFLILVKCYFFGA